MNFRYSWCIFHKYMSLLPLTRGVSIRWKQSNKHSVSTDWLSVVHLMCPASSSSHLLLDYSFTSALIGGAASAYWTVMLMLFSWHVKHETCDTPVTSIPDTSGGITLQQWMTAFILFTGGSLQKRLQPPINLFSALGWVSATFCVALTQSRCHLEGVTKWPWSCLSCCNGYIFAPFFLQCSHIDLLSQMTMLSA